MGQKSVWRIQGDCFISSVIEAYSPTTILDIGCGARKWVSHSSFINIIGVDNVSYPGVDVVCDANHNVPLASSAFDFILMNNFLEHTLYPQKALSEANRLLLVGKPLVLTVPFLMKTHQEPVDYFRYTPFALREMLEESGFRVIRIVPLTSIHETQQTHLRQYFKIIMSHTRSSIKRKIIFVLSALISNMLFFLARLTNTLKVNSSNYTIGFGVLCEKEET